MKHHRTIIIIHWLTTALVATVFLVAVVRMLIEDGESRRLWLDIHRSIGLAVLLLVIARMFVRATVARGQVGELPPALRAASTLSHVVLYAALLALPLIGWAQSSARTQHFRLFGVTLPSLVGRDADLADSLGQWHSALAWGLLAVIGLHAAAALWHHHVRRDNVLRSMLPSRR